MDMTTEIQQELFNEILTDFEVVNDAIKSKLRPEFVGGDDICDLKETRYGFYTVWNHNGYLVTVTIQIDAQDSEYASNEDINE